MTTTPILEFEHVDTYYGNIQVLYDVNLTVDQGELVCLLGGNASGKSTTLKTILGVSTHIRIYQRCQQLGLVEKD